MASETSITRREALLTPLAITSDKNLTAEIVRLGKTVGQEIRHAPRATGNGHHWLLAPLVLIGLDAVPSIRRSRLPLRHGVVFVLPSPEQQLVDQACKQGGAVGVSHVCVLPDGAPWLADLLASLTPR